MFWSAKRVHVVCVTCVPIWIFLVVHMQLAGCQFDMPGLFDHTITQQQMGGWLVNRKGSRRKQLQSLLSYYSGNCMEGLRYTIKIFSKTCWSPGHEMQYFHSPKADCFLLYYSMWSLWLTLIYHLHHKLLFFPPRFGYFIFHFQAKWYWQTLDYTNSYF
jgi:hypothetical protein